MSFFKGIKSIQRGTVSITQPATSNTATITAVDTSKALLSFLGINSDGTNFGYGARIVLTNATTITMTKSGNDTNSNVISYEVVEYY